MKKAFKSLAKEFGNKSKKAFTLTEAEKKRLKGIRKTAPKKIGEKMTKYGKNIDFRRAYGLKSTKPKKTKKKRKKSKTITIRIKQNGNLFK